MPKTVAAQINLGIGQIQRTSKMAASKPFIVGALDIGTALSGWAFSFNHYYEKDPTSASVKHWYSGGQLATEKAPTCLLIKPDHTLQAFGYEAENEYKELVESSAHREYYFFRRFKMALNTSIEQDLSLDFTIKDEAGNPLPALTVFSLCIGFLVNDLVKECNKQIVDPVIRDGIHWVITVPAIWTDAAKQFMREAAFQAGLKPEMLSIALEPESASIFCRHLSVNSFVKGDTLSAYPPGTKYMILDAGGGTIDITVHQITKSGRLKEIMAASGGGWGGTQVDKAFEKLMSEIVGEDVFERFKDEEPDDFIDLGRTFEQKKKTIDPEQKGRVVIRTPQSLKEIYEGENDEETLEDAIAESEFSSNVSMHRDKISFQAQMIKNLFDEPIKKTITHIKSLMENPNASGLKAILMVGGFSDSPMLQSAVRRSFPNLNVIIPKDASSAVLRGAVICGHEPKFISTRVARYTYGIATCSRFIEGRHPERRKKTVEGESCCTGVFDKHIEKGQFINIEETPKEKDYWPLDDDQEKIGFPVYASDLPNPLFVDEGCSLIGNLEVDLTGLSNKLQLRVSLALDDTEIKATARIGDTGKTVTAKFSCFGDRKLNETMIRR